MIYLAHLGFLHFIFYYSLLCPPAVAVLFDDENSMMESRQKAATLKEHVHPGTLIFTNSDGTSTLDYASATAIGKPGSSQTQWIISCAHPYVARKDMPDCKVFFCDHLGVKHPIITDRIKSLSNEILDAPRDIALYYVANPIPCNPRMEIARQSPQEGLVTSLSYGFSLAANKPLSFCSVDPLVPYYLENTIQLRDQVYIKEYESQQILYVEEGHHFVYSYVAKYPPRSVPQPQFYRHDSGASWFYGNQRDGYFLTALSAQMAKVAFDDIESATSRSPIFTVKSHDRVFNLQYLQMGEPQTFGNIYTPLAPHRDWIHAQIQ